MKAETLDEILESIDMFTETATPGPWMFVDMGEEPHLTIGPADGPPVATINPTFTFEQREQRGYLINAVEVSNAQIIAGSIRWLPRLAAEIRRLRRFVS